MASKLSQLSERIDTAIYPILKGIPRAAQKRLLSSAMRKAIGIAPALPVIFLCGMTLLIYFVNWIVHPDMLHDHTLQFPIIRWTQIVTVLYTVGFLIYLAYRLRRSNIQRLIREELITGGS